MQKVYIFLCFCFFFNISGLIASSKTDSIGVENSNGKKVILHKVEAKESYYSVGRRYNVAPKDIMSYNENKFFNIGVIIKVPTQIPFTSKQPEANQTKSTPAPTRHIVKAKENLGVIAERYHTTVDALKQANGLRNSNLSIGQVLNIPGKNNIPATEKTTENAATTNTQATKYIEYTVRPKEYLNKIAEKYNTTADEIKRINNLSSNNLSIGQVLKVPAADQQEGASSTVLADLNTESESTHKTIAADTKTAFFHIVLAGETIFSLAQKFKVTAYQLRQANNMENNTIVVGQQLIIPGLEGTKSAAADDDDDDDVVPETPVSTIVDPKLKGDPTIYGLNQVEEKGTAVWITEPGLDETKMMVLHRTLPVGSVIKITNPMTNISAFVKVVGKFTENETTKDAIIVSTKAVAEKLGVLDKRFFCHITYAPQENEQ